MTIEEREDRKKCPVCGARRWRRWHVTRSRGSLPDVRRSADPPFRCETDDCAGR